MTHESDTRPAAQRAAAWMDACRQELMRLDPRYVVLFNLRHLRFGGDCTAAQLHRALHSGGYTWAPKSRDTTARWVQEILAVEARHRESDADHL